MKLLILLTILFASIAIAGPNISQEDIIFEKTLSKSFTIAKNIDLCQEIEYEKDTKYLDQGYKTYLTLFFKEKPTGKSTITAFINLELDPVFSKTVEEIDANYVMIHLPNSSLIEKNTIKFCVNTENDIDNIEITRDSKVGTYKVPIFLAEDMLITFPEEVRQFEETVVNVKLKNSGKASKKINFKSFDVNSLPHLYTYVKGQAAATLTIQPGETFETNFVLRVNSLGKSSVFFPIIEYTNIEGKQEIIRYEKRFLLNVLEGTPLFKSFFTLQKTDFQMGDNMLDFTVQNLEELDVKDIVIEFETKGKTNIKKKVEIKNLKQLEKQELKVKAEMLATGQDTIGCTVNYKIGDQKFVQKCNPVIINITWHPMIPLMLGIGLILIVIVVLFNVFKRIYG